MKPIVLAAAVQAAAIAVPSIIFGLRDEVAIKRSRDRTLRKVIAQ
jgi:hypothetical protein